MSEAPPPPSGPGSSDPSGSEGSGGSTPPPPPPGGGYSPPPSVPGEPPPSAPGGGQSPPPPSSGYSPPPPSGGFAGAGDQGGGYGSAPGGSPSQLSQSDERMWSLMAHIGAVLVSFIAPLVVMLVQGDKSAFVKRHSVESLNFQITLLIVGIPLTLITCGIGAIIFVVGYVFEIIGGIKANNGEEYRYPVNIRLVK